MIISTLCVGRYTGPPHLHTHSPDPDPVKHVLTRTTARQPGASGPQRQHHTPRSSTTAAARDARRRPATSTSSSPIANCSPSSNRRSKSDPSGVRSSRPKTAPATPANASRSTSVEPRACTAWSGGCTASGVVLRVEQGAVQAFLFEIGKSRCFRDKTICR